MNKIASNESDFFETNQLISSSNPNNLNDSQLQQQHQILTQNHIPSQTPNQYQPRINVQPLNTTQDLLRELTTINQQLPNNININTTTNTNDSTINTNQNLSNPLPQRIRNRDNEITNTRTLRSSNLDNNTKIFEMFNELKCQIDLIKNQNSSKEKSIVNTEQLKFNELGGVLITCDTMDFYFKKVEELFTKLARCQKNLSIHQSYISNNTVPNSLSCHRFPKPMFQEDQGFVEKYNQLFNNQQIMILKLNVEHINIQLDQISGDLLNLKT